MTPETQASALDLIVELRRFEDRIRARRVNDSRETTEDLRKLNDMIQVVIKYLR
jgi:hypothetical protein